MDELRNLRETALMCIDYVGHYNAIERQEIAIKAINRSYNIGTVVDPDELDKENDNA